MRWLKKSLWQETGFPWPLILLGLAGVLGKSGAGVPLENAERGQFRAGNRRYSAGDGCPASGRMAGGAGDLRQQSAVATTSQ